MPTDIVPNEAILSHGKKYNGVGPIYKGPIHLHTNKNTLLKYVRWKITPTLIQINDFING